MPEPEEILILDKKAKEAFQGAIETTLVNVIGTMQTFLFELKKIDDPDYNEKFYEQLLSLAEEVQKIQGKLNKDEHVTLAEFTACTNRLTNSNEQLKKYKFASKKADMLARLGKQVFPQGAVNQQYEQMEPIHQAIRGSVQTVIKQVDEVAKIISEHHSTPKQKTALQAFFTACSALTQTWKGKLDKVFTFSPKEQKEKVGMFDGFKKISRSSFESLHNTVRDTAHQAQEQAKSLKRKTSSAMSSENKENEAEEPVGKRPTLVTGFKEELEKKFQEIQAKRAEKEKPKPPSPSP